jgi:hypothetical protein
VSLITGVSWEQNIYAQEFFFLQGFVCLNDSKRQDLPPFLNAILVTVVTFRSVNDAGSAVIPCSSDARTLILILMH